MSLLLRSSQIKGESQVQAKKFSSALITGVCIKSKLNIEEGRTNCLEEENKTLLGDSVEFIL